MSLFPFFTRAASAVQAPVVAAQAAVTAVQTVEDVLASFARTVEALNAIADHHTAQMDAHDRAIADLEAARAASDAEAAKAQAAAGRIAALIAG